MPEHIRFLDRTVRHGFFDRLPACSGTHGQDILVHACYNGKRSNQLTAYYNYVAGQQANVLAPGPIDDRLDMSADLNVICFGRNIRPERFQLWKKCDDGVRVDAPGL